jgi:hypothetical protein
MELNEAKTNMMTCIELALAKFHMCASCNAEDQRHNIKTSDTMTSILCIDMLDTLFFKWKKRMLNFSNKTVHLPTFWNCSK